MKRCFIILSLILLVVIAFAIWGLPALVKSRLENFLAQQGLGDVIITAMNRDRGEIMFSNIALDKDKFSTIDSIRTRVRWPALFSNEGTFSELVIDGLALTGEMKDDGTLDIAGWTPAAAVPAIAANSIILNSGKIDLDTGAGAIRLEAKGRMTRQPDGSQKTEAALWGTQHQLVLDTRWDATRRTDNSWTASTELRELRLNLSWIAVSRSSGWLTIESKGGIKTLPAVAGQIAAGQVKLGENAVISNANLTIDTPATGGIHIIFDGTATNHGDLSLNAEITHTGTGAPHIHASLGADDINDLLEFITDLNAGLQAAPGRDDLLTTLMITPGNMKRIAKDVKQVKYDTLEMVIDGEPGDLTGKIIARRAKDGGEALSVISMNPAD